MGKTTAVAKLVDRCRREQWDEVFISCTHILRVPNADQIFNAVADNLNVYQRHQFIFVVRDAAGHLQQPIAQTADEIAVSLMVVPFVTRDGRGLKSGEISRIERCVEIHTDGNSVRLLPRIFTPDDLDSISPAVYAKVCDDFRRSVEHPYLDVASFLRPTFERPKPFELLDTVEIGVLLGARIEILPQGDHDRTETYLDAIEIDDADLIEAVREMVPRIEHVGHPYSISRGIPHALLQAQVMRLGDRYEALSRNGNATVEIAPQAGGAIVRSWTDDGKMLFEEAVAVGASGVCPAYLPHLIKETMTEFGAFMKNARHTGHIGRVMH